MPGALSELLQLGPLDPLDRLTTGNTSNQPSSWDKSPFHSGEPLLGERSGPLYGLRILVEVVLMEKGIPSR